MTDLIAVDEVVAWLKARRDEWKDRGGALLGPWYTLDSALDDFREHMHTGTPLDQPVQGPHDEEQG